MITNLIIRVSKQKQKRKTLKTLEVQNQAIRKICYVLCNFEAIKRRHGCFVPSTNSLSLEIIYILFYNYLMEWKYKYGTLTIFKALGRKTPRNEMKFQYCVNKIWVLISVRACLSLCVHNFFIDAMSNSFLLFWFYSNLKLLVTFNPIYKIYFIIIGPYVDCKVPQKNI